MPAESDHPEILVPAPFVYAGFVLAALLLHWALPLGVPASTFLRGLGAVLVVAGLSLGGLAARSMMRAHTTVSPHRPATVLVTSGPYRFTRNPIYLGFLLIFLGFTLMAGTLWGILLAPVLPILVNWLVIDPEERYLQHRFPGDYGQYRSRVRKWI